MLIFFIVKWVMKKFINKKYMKCFFFGVSGFYVEIGICYSIYSDIVVFVLLVVVFEYW